MIESLSIVSDLHMLHSINRLHWSQISDTLGSLRKLKVGQSLQNRDFSIWELLRGRLCPSLRDLELSSVVFGRAGAEEKEHQMMISRFVDFFDERDERGVSLGTSCN